MSRKIDLYAVSKVVSHALHHEPWLYGIELDDHGWVPVTQLISSLKNQTPKWKEIDEKTLQAVIDSSIKIGYEIKDGMIRAIKTNKQ